MKTVVICGSMRFAGQMQETALELETRFGFNVLQCVYNPSGRALTGDDIAALEAAHRRKIELADAVYIMDIGGYIGASARGEMEYAAALGKEIILHSNFAS